MTSLDLSFFYTIAGDTMKVKCFDYEHEHDLEKAINKFLEKKDIEIKSICYSTSHFFDNKDQIYSFSCLILYSETE